MKRLLTVLFMLIAAGCVKCSDDVARVGDTVISVAEYRRVLARKVRAEGVKEADDRLRSEVLNALVDRRLLALEAQRRGLAVSAAELDASVGGARRSAGSAAAFFQALQREELTENGFRDETEETLLAEKLRGVLADSVSVGEEEALEYFRRNKDEFVLPDRYRVHLLPVAGQAEGSDLARRALQDETVLAKELSQVTDPVLVKLNALTPLSTADQFPPEVAEVLPKLKSLDIAGPIKTKRGWLLVRLLEVQPREDGVWETARARVLHLLYQEKKDRVVAEWLAAQRKTVRIDLHGEILGKLTK